MDEKPLSSERTGEDGGGMGEGGEEEGEGDDAAKKKPSDSEDDEPPPPYSKTDPQEAKFDKRDDPHVPEADQTARKLRAESTSPDSGSATNISHVSSPNRVGRTLSDLTRITPEDEARVHASRENLLATDLAHLESLSDTTLVNSETQSEAGQSSVSTDVSVKLEPPKVRTRGEVSVT